MAQPTPPSSDESTVFDPANPRQMAAMRAEIGRTYPRATPSQLETAIRCAVGNGTGKRKKMVILALAKMYLSATRT